MNIPLWEERRNALVRKIIDEHIAKIEQIQSHSVDQCVVGDHLLESVATGFRNGHCISKCLLCDYKAEGWD